MNDDEQKQIFEELLSAAELGEISLDDMPTLRRIVAEAITPEVQAQGQAFQKQVDDAVAALQAKAAPEELTKQVTSQLNQALTVERSVDAKLDDSFAALRDQEQEALDDIAAEHTRTHNQLVDQSRELQAKLAKAGWLQQSAKLLSNLLAYVLIAAVLWFLFMGWGGLA